MDKKPNGIFTVDVEEYYHAENVLYSLPPARAGSLPSRVRVGTRKILELLAKHAGRATFFILACVAEKDRGLIKEISDAGHEIASHGYEHIPLYKHTPATFEKDLKKSIEILSGITGAKVIGFRATSFSISENTPWFFDILMKYGIIYDSSVSPSFFRKSLFRIPETPSRFEIRPGLTEVPVSFAKIGPFRIPLGGGYFRAYPYWLTKRLLRRAARLGGSPPVFYIHPWELDPAQPRIKTGAVKSLRQYLGLSTAEAKLDRLLAETRFISIKEFLS